MDGDNVSPLVLIGLTDLPKTGGGLNPPSPPTCDSPAEAFVLFMEKIRGRSHLKVSIPCFPGVLGERTEKGMMFTRHHSVEK